MYSKTISEMERTLIAHAMELQGGNPSEAAEYLGIHRNTLRKKLRTLGEPGREE